LAGIYIHIPFCKQACTYCNFHFSTNFKQKDAFLTALKKEISLQTDFISSEEVIETIYFGGGTPSLLSSDELSNIIETLQQKFTISSDAEITIEANPDDITTAVVKEWMLSGINRLSLGVQSFFDEELTWMNRAHNASHANKSINDILSAGITDFSVDLIFGSPLLSDAILEQNINIIINKNIPHISCYALTVESKTALQKFIETKKTNPIDVEKQASQFLLIMDKLIDAGYEHYEISNYAKLGMRSKHNSSYWQGKSYYGFGPSAHSFNGKNIRKWNVSNNAIYIKQLAENIIPSEEELLTTTQEINEYIMTALRTTKGIQTAFFAERFGDENSKLLLKYCNKYVLTGKISVSDNLEISLTREGKLFADGIAADLFFE
jgi:oxygen-independent coproporphyrinogen-3 oxidase